MSIFVFRNNTIERFFSKEYGFSGYDDISDFPHDAQEYIWWYQVPIKFDRMVLYEEIEGYIDKLELVLSSIDRNRLFVLLTMDIFFDSPFTEDDNRIQKAVADYNSALYDAAARYDNVKVIDITEFTRRYPAGELIDWKFYFISQMGMNPRLSNEFKQWWDKKTSSIALKRKKCLILDLDNTLWGGILGEDGVEGIRIGGDYPGKAFQYWQEALLELSRNGVILAICSKNNEQDVFEAWERNPFIILKKEHFASWRINWTDKATNLKSLSEELNIGLDSFVFVDDNPAEREIIRQMLPMVSVPEFPEHPYDLPVFFKQIVEEYFKVYCITEEDRNKNEQYRQNAQRVEARKAFSNFDDYLKSLQIHITLEKANDFNIGRIAQMTQKTNQFNLTTRRYTDADIRGLIDGGWMVWCLGVADKFGDNGITGVIIINPDSEIDTFLLSCRILGKGIEKAFIKKMHQLLKKDGLVGLEASYLPTPKNAQVKDFWKEMGYTCISEAEDGSKRYSIRLQDADVSIEDYYNITVK